MADIKIEVFVNKNWKEGDKVFSHNWFNDGKDYFDSVIQNKDGYGHTIETESIDFISAYDGATGPCEYYLEEFKANGYTWEKIIPTKRQFDGINSFTMQIDDSTFDILPTMFVKVTGYGNSSYPLYYYSTRISGVTDQNIDRVSYEVEFQLDIWASCWIYFHHFMKDTTDYTDFLNKMCDRFIFNVQRNDAGELIDSKGFIIDYQRQPYLMRSGKYETQLVVNDDRENFLSLEEWLFINSGKTKVLDYNYWIENTWLSWLESPYVGLFNPKEKGTTEQSPAFTAEDIGKYQNKYAELLSEGFYDTDFNSNTKYRYLVCKVGNNTSPEKQQSEKPAGMFTNYKYDTVKCTPATATTATSLDTSEWTEESQYSYSYYKEVALEGVNVSSGAVTISWDNWLIDEKAITMKFISDLVGEYYVTWTDDLQLQSHRKVLKDYIYDKEYSIIDLPTKSYAFDIYGDYVNVSLSINIKFKSATEASLIFRVKFDKNYEKIVWPTITAQLNEAITINSFYIAQTGTSTTETDNVINGETLMIIPFKKGTKEADYIKNLNSVDNGICMGDGSVLGMPINDIPPSVLALAIRRQNDDSDWQSIGDILSVRHVENISCPVDIVDFKLGTLNMPVMFSSFDNIPVVVATAPLKDNIYECVGGNKFFNYYYEILTQDHLTTNVEYYDTEGNLKIRGGNRKEVEPFLYGPQFWKWAYFIDGAHSINLTGEKLDFEKLITKEDWEVKLNVSLNATTNYFLDISEIKNNKYPMSKLGMEFINSDPASFPFTTEAYNNWAQGNQLTQETAKNAKDITNEYVKKRGIVDATIGSLEAGANAASHSAGRGFFGLKGAAAGALAGALVAGAHAAGAIAGMELTMAENNKQFENKWRGELGNMYNSPSQLNPSGFTSGSLIYSAIKSSNQNSYELFRTLSAPDYILESVWQDIAMNGYPFLSQCPYSDYNNRLRFNIVNCKLTAKQHKFIDVLKKKMFNINPIFANDDYILPFISKCLEGFRVFKCQIDYDNMEQIISENIELVREWVQAYNAPKKTVVIETGLQSSDLQTSEWVWADNYEISENVISKKVTEEVHEIDIPFEDLNMTSWDDLATNFDSIELGNKDTFGLILFKNGEDYDYKVVKNTVEYGPEGIKTYDLEGDISSLSGSEDLKYAIIATKDETEYTPEDYKLGWSIVVSQNEENVHVKMTPYSKWIFEDGLDLSGATISNYTKKFPTQYKKSISLAKTYDALGTSTTGTIPDNTNLKKIFGLKLTDGSQTPPTPMDWEYDSAPSRSVTLKFSDLGFEHITDKSSFLEYFEKITLPLNDFSIVWKTRPSGTTDWTTESVKSSDSIEIAKDELSESSGVYSATKEIILCGINKSSAKHNIDTGSDETKYTTFCGYTHDISSYNKSFASSASFYSGIKVKFTVNDKNIVVHWEYICNYYRGWSGWPYSPHGDGIWGEAAIWAQNADKQLNVKMNVSEFVIDTKSNDVASKWFMNNNLNNLVFIRKDKKNSSSLLRNKKEG